MHGLIKFVDSLVYSSNMVSALATWSKPEIFKYYKNKLKNFVKNNQKESNLENSNPWFTLNNQWTI